MRYTSQASRDLSRAAVEVGFEAARLLVVDDDLAGTPTFSVPQADRPPLRVEIKPRDRNHEVAAALLALDTIPRPAAAP